MMRKAEEYVRYALHGGCRGRRAYFKLNVPKEEAHRVSREIRNKVFNHNGNGFETVETAECIEATGIREAGNSGGNDLASLKLRALHCNGCAAVDKSFVPEVNVTLSRDPECRLPCCTVKKSESIISPSEHGDFSNGSFLRKSDVEWNYHIFMGTDVAEDAYGELRISLNSGQKVSSLFVFIDDAVLEHAQHRRRLKSLARGLVGMPDHITFSTGCSGNSGCPNCSPCPTAQSSSCNESRELPNSEDEAAAQKPCLYPCCCICCSPFVSSVDMVDRKDMTDGSSDRHQAASSCSIKHSSTMVVANTPIVFFALRGGEQCKTLRAVHALQCAILGINEQCKSGNEADQSLRLRRIFYRGREQTKDVATKIHVPVDRGSLLVGIGGGSVTDLIGFSASTLLRGVRFCLVPTTILAACDAAVGGKTAVNCGGVKNSVGSFCAPTACLIDTAFFCSLPLRHRAAGMAEIIKIAACLSPMLFTHILKVDLDSLGFTKYVHSSNEANVNKDSSHLVQQRELLRIIAAAVVLKALVVSNDFREQGLRKVLNFGHTFGHALESVAGGAWEHGECVGVGMLLELLVGRRVGVGGSLLYFLVKEALRRFGLPTSTFCLTYEKQQQMLSLMQADKKNYCGDVHVVLLNHLGCPVKEFTRQIPVEILKQTLASQRRLNYSSLTHARLCGHVTVPGIVIWGSFNLYGSICGATWLWGSKQAHKRYTVTVQTIEGMVRHDCAGTEDDPRSFAAVFDPYQYADESPIMRSLSEGGRVTLWCGGSGTASRFLLPTVAALLVEAAFSYVWSNFAVDRGCNRNFLDRLSGGDHVLPRFEVLLDGDSQLRKRPIGPLVDATRHFVQCCAIDYLDATHSLPVLMSVDPLALLPQIRSLHQQASATDPNEGRTTAWQAVLAKWIPQQEIFVSNTQSSQYASSLMMAAVLSSKSIMVRLTKAMEPSVLKDSSRCSGLKTTGASECYENCSIKDKGEIVSLPYLLMTKSLLERLGFSCSYHAPASFLVESTWCKRHESESLTVLSKGERSQIEATADVFSSDEIDKYVVEADASSASYFFGMAACTGGAVAVNINKEPELQGDCSFPYFLKVLGCRVTTRCVAPSQTGYDTLSRSDDVFICLEGPKAGVIPHSESVVIDLKNHSDCLPTLAATVAAMATQNSLPFQGWKGCPYSEFPSAPVFEQLRALCTEALESHKRTRLTTENCSTTSVGTMHTDADILTSTWPLRSGNWRIVVICGVGFVRYKESDRLSVLERELTKAGYCVWRESDYLCIAVPVGSGREDQCYHSLPRDGSESGKPCCLSFQECENIYLSCEGDHRLAMSWAILGLRRQDIFASDWKCVEKTFADFWTTAEKDLQLLIKAP